MQGDGDPMWGGRRPRGQPSCLTRGPGLREVRALCACGTLPCGPWPSPAAVGGRDVGPRWPGTVRMQRVAVPERQWAEECTGEGGAAAATGRVQGEATQ